MVQDEMEILQSSVFTGGKTTSISRDEVVRGRRQANEVKNSQWGAFFAVAGGVAYAVSPLYRGLTVQFKT